MSHKGIVNANVLCEFIEDLMLNLLKRNIDFFAYRQNYRHPGEGDKNTNNAILVLYVGQVGETAKKYFFIHIILGQRPVIIAGKYHVSLKKGFYAEKYRVIYIN